MEEELAYEKLKQIMEDIFFKSLKNGKPIIEDIGRIEGSNIYYIGSGCYTNEVGWREFQEELKKQFKNEK